jgi:hypothetical protein
VEVALKLDNGQRMGKFRGAGWKSLEWSLEWCIKGNNAQRENMEFLTDFLSDCDQNAGGKMDGKSHFNKASDRNVEHVTRK